MNLLPLIILFLLLKNDKFAGIKDFLAKIDFASFAPLLKLIGANDKIIEFLSSEKFSELLSGNASPSEFADLVSSSDGLFSKKNSPEQSSDENITDFKLNPIKDVASSDIEEDLGSFFS